jgi:hypothetical protein
LTSFGAPLNIPASANAADNQIIRQRDALATGNDNDSAAHRWTIDGVSAGDGLFRVCGGVPGLAAGPRTVSAAYKIRKGQDAAV